MIINQFSITSLMNVTAGTSPIFFPVTLVDWITIISGLATAALVIILVWQTSILNKQTKLAYKPFLAPDVSAFTIGRRFLTIANKGGGHAKEVNITIKDDDGRQLVNIENHSLASGSSYISGIDMNEHLRVMIKGSYKDLTNTTYVIEQEYKT